eukprot:m.1040055 g.1040055  ORF g.1040055 m.1040055 type:complete len:947 (+) comp24152_c0_seq10:199-3039(+)
MADATRRLKAVQSYQAKKDGELSINIGDVIFVPNMDKQTGKMLNGVSGGKVGMFPRSVVEDTTITHTDGSVTAVLAIHEYEAENESEISFPLGAKMFVVKRIDEKWWQGVYSEKAGLIPASHIQAAETKKIVSSAERANILDSIESKIKRVNPRASIKGKPSARGEGGTGKASAASPARTPAKDAPPKWDWGKLEKNRAERELQGYPDGTFLVRESESSIGTYSFSVVSRGAVRHVRILDRGTGFAINERDTPVATIQDLVKELSQHTVKVRLAGTQSQLNETRLIVKALPRTANAPPPSAHKARPGANKTRVTAPPPAPPSGKTTPRKTGPAMPAPPTSVPTFPLNDVEKNVYEGLWKRVQGSERGFVEARPTAQYLTHAGLDNVTLGHIWNLSDILEPKGQLSKGEFFVALKLIALTQSTGKFSIDALKAPAKIPQLRGQTEVVQAEFRPPAPVLLKKKAAGVEWVVSNADLATYNSFFKGVDRDNDGLVNGADVMGIFLSSKLSKDVLAQVWNLVDTKANGLLNAEQFALAMWIISEKVKGVEVPKKLAPNMVPPSLREGGTPPRSVSNGSGGDAAPVPAAVPQNDPVDDPFATPPAPEESAPPVAAPAPSIATTAPPAAEVPSPDEYLSPAERAVYDKLWDLMVNGDTDAELVGPAVGAAFLQSSGLDNDALGAVWEASDVLDPKGQLSKAEVFVALKLIARMQQGADAVTMADVHTPSPLPLLTPHTHDVQATLASAAAAAAAVGGSVVPAGQEDVYSALWRRASGDNDSLGPGDAVVFLRASGLDDQALSVIWEKADSSDPKGQLSQEEFFVALKLIALTQAGAEPVLENINQDAALPHLDPHTADVQNTTGFLSKRLWAEAGGTDGSTLDGGTLRPILLQSNVDQEVLGEIWGMADTGAVGRLDFAQFRILLGLISQAQRGEMLDETTVTDDTIAATMH